MEPGGVAVIGGDTGAGKSTYFFNFILLNDAFHDIYYISTELNREEVNAYLTRFQTEKDIQYRRKVSDWRFKMKLAIGHTINDYPQFIEPDKINIFDWIQLEGDDYANVAACINRMKAKVGKGLLIVALQKKQGADHAAGGGQSEYGASLHLLFYKNREDLETRVYVRKARYLQNSAKNPEGKSIWFRNPRGTKLQFDPDGFGFSNVLAPSTSAPFKRNK